MSAATPQHAPVRLSYRKKQPEMSAPNRKGNQDNAQTIAIFVVIGLVALYIVVQLARHRRMLRFANMELLESVAPKRPSRWRHSCGR